MRVYIYIYWSLDIYISHSGYAYIFCRIADVSFKCLEEPENTKSNSLLNEICLKLINLLYGIRYSYFLSNNTVIINAYFPRDKNCSTIHVPMLCIHIENTINNWFGDYGTEFSFFSVQINGNKYFFPR